MRRKIAAQDPLCCVYAYEILTKHVFRVCTASACAKNAPTVLAQTTHAWTLSEAMQHRWVVV